MRTLVIYLDVLLTVNLAADYFLLLLTARFLRLGIRRRRILLGSGWGALSSLAIFLPAEISWLTLPCGFLFAGGMVFFAFGKQPRRTFFRTMLALFGSNALFTGMMTLLWVFVAPKGLLVRNNVVYYDCSPWLLLGLLALSYTILRVGERVVQYRAACPVLRQVRLTTSAGSVLIRGMVDSGNLLTEAFSGLPVLVLQVERAKELLPTELWAVFSGELQEFSALDAYPEWKKHFRLIPFTALSGKGCLPAFSATAEILPASSPPRPVCVAVCREPFATINCDALLPQDL